VFAVVDAPTLAVVRFTVGASTPGASPARAHERLASTVQTS
jgi:hypothetical protein